MALNGKNGLESVKVPDLLLGCLGFPIASRWDYALRRLLSNIPVAGLQEAIYYSFNDSTVGVFNRVKKMSNQSLAKNKIYSSVRNGLETLELQGYLTISIPRDDFLLNKNRRFFSDYLASMGKYTLSRDERKDMAHRFDLAWSILNT